LLVSGLNFAKQVLQPFDCDVLAQEGNLGVPFVHLTPFFFLLKTKHSLLIVIVPLAPLDPSPFR
jgi:hypothetical protein